MPEGAVYVGRPTKWGNPWSPIGYYEAGYTGILLVAAKACIEQFRAWMTQTRSTWSGDIPEAPWSISGLPESGRRIPDVTELRGKDLACWCPLEDKDGNPVPCHADVLLELANREDVP